MDWLCYITLYFVCKVVAYDVNNGPLQVYYKDGDQLQVNFQFENIPDGYDKYVINKVTGDQRGQFESGELKKLDKKKTILDKKDNGSILELTLKKFSSFERGPSRKYIKLNMIDIESTEKKCIKKACTILIDWKNDNSKATPAATGNDVLVLVSPSEYNYEAATIRIHPHIIYFKDNDILNVTLGFKNVQDAEIKDHHLYISKGSKYLKDIEYRRTQTKKNEAMKLNRNYDNYYLFLKTTMIKDNVTEDVSLKIINLKYNENRTDESCLARPCKIVLDFTNTYLDDQPQIKGLAENPNGTNFRKSFKETPKVAILIAVLVIAVVLIVLSAWVVMRRRKNSHIKNNNATAQVTYAILNMPAGSGKVPIAKEEPSPYAEIVGIYKPKPDKNKK